MNNYDINKTLLQKYWCLSMQYVYIVDYQIFGALKGTEV